MNTMSKYIIAVAAPLAVTCTLCLIGLTPHPVVSFLIGLVGSHIILTYLEA